MDRGTERVQLREARRDEVEAVARVHFEARRAAFAPLLPPALLDGRPLSLREEQWRELLEHPGLGRDRFALVLEEAGGRLVGCASAGPPREPMDGFGGEVYRVYLLPEWTGRGWGTRMMEALSGRLRDAGVRSFFLWTLTPHARARRFYERCGGEVLRETTMETEFGPVFKVAYGWREVTSPCPRSS